MKTEFKYLHWKESEYSPVGYHFSVLNRVHDDDGYTFIRAIEVPVLEVNEKAVKIAAIEAEQAVLEARMEELLSEL